MEGKFFFPGEQSKKGSNVHIEVCVEVGAYVCVEVGAYVEKLVRMTHVLHKAKMAIKNGLNSDVVLCFPSPDGAWLSRWSTKGPC